MPTVIDVLQWYFYLVLGSMAVALSIAIVGSVVIELRKKWPT